MGGLGGGRVGEGMADEDTFDEGMAGEDMIELLMVT